MIDLSSLLLNLSGLDESAKKAEGWRWYQQLYLSDPEKPHIGTLPLHDAEKAIFHDRTFDHAFYKSSNYRLYPKRKDVIDATRLARVRWIGPLIAGEVANSSCYEVVALSGRPGVPNRVYIAVIWFSLNHAPIQLLFSGASVVPFQAHRNTFVLA